MTNKKVLYSVIIPVFNSEKIITETVKQIIKVFDSSKLKFEMILVNDASDDDSWDVIKRIAKKDQRITSINFLKNYGQHNANMCGFRHSKGDFIITMDDDLQNPPKEIPKLIKKINEGYDLVIGKFETKKHSLFRRLGSKIIGILNRKIFDVRENLVLSNFRIARKSTINLVCNDKSFDPYVPGLLLKYSSKRSNVEVRHDGRKIGKSNYTLGKISSLTFNLLINHSSIPLRFGLMIGLIFSSISFLASLYFLIYSVFKGTGVPGWSTIVISISFFNGVLILLISLIGEYIIRTLREVSSQSTYEITEIIRK